MKLNPIQIARSVADQLEVAGVAYGIGGSMAMAGAGYIRATEDVDVSLFVGLDALEKVLGALQLAGADFDPIAVRASVEARADFKVYVQNTRVDLFMSFSQEFFDSMQRRLLQLPLEGRPAWFVTPEDLGVLKMLFFRPKDLLDLERMLAVAGPRFDSTHVRRWLVELMGAEDSRVARWDQLVIDVAAAMK